MPLDLSSFFLATIDFEDAHRIFQSSLSKNTQSNYPPYNIIKLNQNLYRVTLALAGFTKDSIAILLEDNILCVKSIFKDQEDQYEYLYKGIANRSFEKKFQLAENVRVQNAFFKNGLLNIDLIKIKMEKKEIIKIEIKDSF
tara:strand:+ start:2076 stop:2498 length:423 start_codon:yes stop_codon:yes gene_type:complete